MDGVHDLGGLDGFGPVEHKAEEPLFEHDWERRVFRLMIGSLGALGGPGGRFRHSIERMAPEHYLSSPYYEHWLTGVTTMAVESGFDDARGTRPSRRGHFPLSRADRGVLPDDLNPRTEPRYAVGDDVRVRDMASAGTYPRAALRAGQARHGRTCRRRVQHRRHRGARRRIGRRPPLFACASRHANCGAKPEPTATSCTSTCSSATCEDPQ